MEMSNFVGISLFWAVAKLAQLHSDFSLLEMEVSRCLNVGMASYIPVSVAHAQNGLVWFGRLLGYGSAARLEILTTEQTC
jgi:hypothetical protein